MNGADTQVYEQVTKLFGNAPDLIDEFKQFLPENGQGGLGGIGFGSFVQAASGVGPIDKGPAKRGGKDAKEPAPSKKRRGPADPKGQAKVSFLFPQ